MKFLFGADSFSWLFFIVATVMWLITGVFATKYQEAGHMEKGKRFLVVYVATYICIALCCFAQSYLSLYMCFELMTLVSVLLVLHEERTDAVNAAKKYLFYSIFGASIALVGLFIAAKYTDGAFVAGGALDMAKTAGHEKMLRLGLFLSVVGFGAKAGMYPLHSWLPVAHPQAPAPASAVLSSVITKMGVLCIIRVIYFVFGPDLIRGTWVQYTLMCMAMLTILIGSLMACSQQLFKARLAYSTVSQISSILLGIFALSPTALSGALLHVIYHAAIKNCLFLVAAAGLYTGLLYLVPMLEGAGRRMPITYACYTIASLGLVGIPPFSGFLSKWYLATGILELDIPIISWLAPVVLLISALLTAAYLLSIAIKAYFPSFEAREIIEHREKFLEEAPPRMLICLVTLAAIIVILGIFAKPWADLMMSIAGGVF